MDGTRKRTRADRVEATLGCDIRCPRRDVGREEQEYNEETKGLQEEVDEKGKN
jgi:hypothetical protein